MAATLSLLGIGNSMAQSAVVITTKEMAVEAGCQLTIDQLKNLSGTGAHFAFHTTQRTDWSKFDLSDTGQYTIDTDKLYTLTRGSNDDCIWVWNYDGALLTAAGNNTPCTWGDPSATGFDFYITECADGGYAGNYDHDKQFRLRHEPNGPNFRIHEHDFTTAAGDWTRYVAYGPFYVVKVQPTNHGAAMGNPVSMVCSQGEIALPLPNIEGYKPNPKTISVTVNADKTVEVEYSAYNPGTPSEVNLTPWPKDMSVFEGRYTLPDAYTISLAGVTRQTLADSLQAEALRFTSVIKTTTSKEGTISSDANAAITLRENSTVSPEGYNVEISENGINIEASTATGFYFGLQTIKKLLPANVMAGTAGTDGDAYDLPCLAINDEPRFPFRSFMLDCSRHFFTVEEIERMLDVMAIYKMNKFHWHLTDDQGWRAEIERYPLLTSIGATRSKNWTTPLRQVYGYWWTGEGTWDNNQYGPLYYSKKDMRHIVEYAAERHIEIIPEIEMPGHAVAALAAYPQYSCEPSRQYQVWTSGGISEEVMNVANPNTIEFLHNIIDEVCEIFPGQYFHIGGDECPTTKWTNNSDCQNLKNSQGFTYDREIQSYFINQISQYLKDRWNKRTIVWNESITAEHANLDLVAANKPLIMCWNPCQNGAARAASLGLDAVITEYHGNGGGYYINRKQSNDYGEPSGAGAGDDTVEGCYNYVPVPASVSAENATHYLGVQGTFWTEHVDSNEYLEYLALPRLICMAEAGWVNQDQKNWSSFVERLKLDSRILDLGNYVYARHWDPDYKHRTFVSPIADGTTLTFTNVDTNRGQCMSEKDGKLFAQDSKCINFVLEAVPGQANQYYIRSEKSGQYLHVDSYASNVIVTLSSSKTAWTFDEATIPGYVAICPVGNTTFAINNNANDKETKARLWTHTKDNTSSFWSIGLVGDADGNNVITIGDVTYTIGILHDVKQTNAAADADADGTVTADDVTSVANKVMEKH